MEELTHFNGQGRARMVDVTEKAVTCRVAAARGEVHMNRKTFEKIKEGSIQKGDVLAVAQVADIQAAKHTWELIPMCHPLPLTGIDLSFTLLENPCRVEITAQVTCSGVTGVEMEALTAVSTAALTIYDMCKAVQKDMRIEHIRLLSKSGGKSVDTMRSACPIPLGSGVFAENINTRGIDLKSLPIGTRLRIGQTEVEVTQIGKECHSDCAIKQAVGRCVMPTEGIFAVVVREGTVRAGDEIEVLS